MNSKFSFSDLKSGVVVFLVALPLCLGISLACGVPIFSGILSGIVGGIIVGIFSSSRYSVTGPAAGLTAIVVTSISQLGSYEYFLAAVFFAGIFQIIFGVIKAGFISNFIPNAVVKGMLAGIGIILIIKQLPHFVGYDADPEGDMYFVQSDGHNSISDLYYMFNFITPGSLIIGFISFFLLLISEKPFYKKNKIFSFIPGPLLVVGFGILLNVAFSGYSFLEISSKHLVNLPIIKNLNDLKTNLIFPNFTLINDQGFWIIVLTLAIVASIETLLSFEAIDKLVPQKEAVNSNKELVAQGIGNTISGLIGALPLTSVIVRSSANINAGAKSKLSTITHALLLMLSVLFIPYVLRLIPNSALAVILIMIGYKLANISLFKSQYKAGIDQFLPFMATILFMLFTDLLKGVSLGLFIAIIFILKQSYKLPFKVIEETIDGRLNVFIKLSQNVTFITKGKFIELFKNIPDGAEVHIDGGRTRFIDKDVLEIIHNYKDSSSVHKINLVLEELEEDKKN